RRRVLLLRVGEHADVRELGFLQEPDQLVDVRFRLAGEAYDERRTECDPGDGGPDAGQEPADGRPAALAAHRAQHAIADVLQRHVEVAADGGLVRDHLEELVGDRARVGVEEPEPAYIGYADGERAQQRGERRAVATVAAVRRQVLGDEVQL